MTISKNKNSVKNNKQQIISKRAKDLSKQLQEWFPNYFLQNNHGCKLL